MCFFRLFLIKDGVEKALTQLQKRRKGKSLFVVPFFDQSLKKRTICKLCFSKARAFFQPMERVGQKEEKRKGKGAFPPLSKKWGIGKMHRERKKDTPETLGAGAKKLSARVRENAPSDMIETATRIILGERGEKLPEGKPPKRAFFVPFLFGCLFSASLFGAVTFVFLL